MKNLFLPLLVLVLLLFSNTVFAQQKKGPIAFGEWRYSAAQLDNHDEFNAVEFNFGVGYAFNSTFSLGFVLDGSTGLFKSDEGIKRLSNHDSFRASVRDSFISVRREERI